MTYDFEHLDVKIDRQVAFVTIDNPPINLITVPLLGELEALSLELEADRDLKVVVLRSANPGFFLAHFDVAAILERPTGGEPQRHAELKPFQALCERFCAMAKVSIAQIEGRVGGGGSEFAASLDMRFGVRGRTVVNQMEVPLGILPGGSGTQRLPRLLGRGRALEVILAGDDLDAETAERWGYLNRVYDPDEIGSRVEALAYRIASFPAPAVRLAKESVNAAPRPLAEGLREEAFLFERLLRTPEVQANMARFLEIGGQTPEGELRMGERSARRLVRAPAVSTLPEDVKGDYTRSRRISNATGKGGKGGRTGTDSTTWSRGGLRTPVLLMPGASSPPSIAHARATRSAAKSGSFRSSRTARASPQRAQSFAHHRMVSWASAAQATKRRSPASALTRLALVKRSGALP